MKTDDLIAAMAADLPVRPTPPSRALWLGVAASLPVALGLLYLLLGGPRKDIALAIGTVRFDYKLVFLTALAAAGLWLSLRLSIPGAKASGAKVALGAVIGSLVLAIGLEFLSVPSGQWMPSLMGNMPFYCVTHIPMMAAGPLVAILLAMRAGAPDNTTAAGAAAGLLAGAIGAAFYAASCPNDSPFYIAAWYLMGIASVVVIGALAGRQVLRW